MSCRKENLLVKFVWHVPPLYRPKNVCKAATTESSMACSGYDVRFVPASLCCIYGLEMPRPRRA